MPGIKPALGPTGGIKDNLAGAVAYTFIGAVIFLLAKRLKRNRFIRFHSFQCIFLVAAVAVIAVVLRLLFSLLVLIPALGQLLILLISLIGLIACLILWTVLVVKALLGEAFKLPFIGDLAEKQTIRP
jgi:uncharacterized membrane protein